MDANKKDSEAFSLVQLGDSTFFMYHSLTSKKSDRDIFIGSIPLIYKNTSFSLNWRGGLHKIP